MSVALLIGLLALPQTAPQGVMVGEVGPDAATVWTRAERECRVAVRFGTDPDAARMARSAELAATAAADFTAHVRLEGLQPATRYHFRVEFVDAQGAAVAGPAGSFRTAPRPGDLLPFRFAVGGDVLQSGADSLWPRMQAELPDLYLALGDMPYADGARDLDGYRQAHRRVRDHAGMQAFFAQVPVVATWDDHEVENDWDARTDPQRVAWGTRAWREFFPVPRTGPIWHSLRWGRGVEVFVLDTRTQRGANPAPDLPDKTMLGTVQRQWLLDALTASDATFKLVCTSSPLRHGTNGKDSWIGYQRERDALLAELLARGIDGVVFLTADQHWAAAHAHPEGFPEFQFGPVAALLREPPPVPDPAVVAVGRGFNFGLLTFDPDVQPPTLDVECRGSDGALWRRRVVAGGAARLQVTGAAGGVRLQPADGGPGLATSVAGTEVLLPRVAPGRWDLHFGAGRAGKPDSLPLLLAAGDRVHVAVASAPADAGPAELLLRDDFTVLRAWDFADPGVQDGPAAWFVSGGALWQSSGIRCEPAPPEDPFRPGTLAWRGDREWTDYTLRARLWTAGDGTVAVLARWRDADNHYRFTWNRKRRLRRLEAVVGGRAEVLAQDEAAVEPHRWHRVAVRLEGPQLEVRVDGRRVFAVTDGNHRQGAVGFGTGGNLLTAFDALEVRQLDPRGPAAEAVPDWTGTLAGWTDSAGAAPGPRWSAGASLRCAAAGAPGAPEQILLRPDAQRDGLVTVRARCLDGDLGLVARWAGPGDHYGLRWDGERLRLARRVGGQDLLLGEAPAPGRDGVLHELALQCSGFRIEAWFDGAAVIQVMDGALTEGRTGLRVGDGGGEFAGLRIGPPAAPAPVLAVIVHADGRCTVQASAPQHPGAAYALALWRDAAHGPWLDPLARHWLLTTRPSNATFLVAAEPGLPGARGELDRHGRMRMTFQAPRLPALIGQAARVGGFVLEPGVGEVVAALPRAAVVF